MDNLLDVSKKWDHFNVRMHALTENPFCTRLLGTGGQLAFTIIKTEIRLLELVARRKMRIRER